MSVSRVRRPGRTDTVPVKNLGWFFRKARTTEIAHFAMVSLGRNGWRMHVEFADGNVYFTHYASLAVFKDVMNRQRSLKGVKVKIIEGDEHREITLGRAS